MRTFEYIAVSLIAAVLAVIVASSAASAIEGAFAKVNHQLAAVHNVKEN